MEKNATEILREIEAEIASLKERIANLESKISELKTGQEEELAAEPETEEAAPVDFTDMEIGVVEENTPVPEEIPMEDFPVDDLPVEDIPAEDLPVEMEMDMEVSAPVPEVSEPETEPEPARTPAMDPELERMAWNIDKPGIAVKNIRSGISLYDRALFIGTLFKEDFALYDQTIADLNAMENLPEAVNYIVAHFPDWNLRSDIVYNFIMAIRKKLG